MLPLMIITPLRRRQENQLQHQERKMSVIAQELNEMFLLTTGKTVCMYGSGINKA